MNDKQITKAKKAIRAWVRSNAKVSHADTHETANVINSHPDGYSVVTKNGWRLWPFDKTTLAI